MTREEHLFNEALALPPADRAAFIARACADDEPLRRRLAELLEAYASSGDFLAASALPPPPALIEEKPGDILGRYTLVSKLGEGGCGAVYLAEQHEPVRRQVALKVIKLGMDTREVIARFEAERQALALMDHPGIARVYDAGATATGRPFFVMEFVDGVPITQFCDAQQLPVPARLALFADLCLALQHAHQKGIIHRDLKPSNILVTLVDGAPTPKIIDFGIAKATQGKLTAHTLVTRFEQMIGTPVYMSPEQADLRDTDIDTRSDIYSLGVLLYELLTGRPPFDPQSLLQAGVAEIRRIIRETDPPRPSTAVATLADADRTTVAQRRRASPARLPSALSGDLDWIVMRCLEKQRDRRYGTAEELGRDIRRHLQHEPVSARPPSALYRARKFVSRHRFACASAAALALAIVAGAAVSTWQAIRATRAEHEARLAQADAQRRQAEAEDLLTFMLGDFRTELAKIGRLSLLDAVGDKAMTYFASLPPRDQTDVTLLRHSKALTQIGEVRLDEARFTEAAVAFGNAHARALTLTTRHSRDADMLFARAQTEFWLGFIARQRADFATARDWLARYSESAIALAALEGNTARARREIVHARHNSAVLEFETGAFAPAAREFETERTALAELIAAEPDDLEIAGSLADCASWLGTIAECTGNFPRALELYSEMAQRYDALARHDAVNASWRASQVDALSLIGSIEIVLGRRTEAAATYARARSLLEPLRQQDPANQQWRHSAAVIRLQEVALHRAAGDFSTAQSMLAETRAELDDLVARDPSSRWFQRSLALAWRTEAQLRLERRQPDAATAIEHALRLGESLRQALPADRLIVSELAQARLTAGHIASAAEHNDAAREHWEKAFAALAPLVRDSSDWRIIDPAVHALVVLGQLAEARPLATRLRSSGYHPLDPFAASAWEAITPPVNPPTQN